MNFNNTNLWPFVILGISFLVYFSFFLDTKFFAKIKDFWFYKRSFLSQISSLFYYLGFLLLLISLLDLRGPEEKVESKVSENRTVILVDTSASMLAEDVGPSRLQKAILMAKHFARKAPGHQISIVAFAEIQKKIVPFTNDLDLIDSRLESLKSLRNHSGSSALTKAIQESIQYLKESSGEAEGNILVYTDGEETAEVMNLNVLPSVRVALVGIGTEQGGRIPLDDARGLRFGYKKNKGVDVITKLNEDFFKIVTKDIPTSRYWLASTYSLPSDEIVDFFQSEKLKVESSQLMTIKPVLMQWLVVPALLLFILSFLLKRFKIFTLTISLFVFYLQPSFSNDVQREIPADLLQSLNDLHQGKLSRGQRVELAHKLNKAGAKDEALTLFQENLDSENLKSEFPPEAYLNYGTALLENGNASKGLKIYEKILDQYKDDEKFKEIISQNISSFFWKQQQEEQKKKNEEDKKNNKESDQSKEQNKDGSSNQQNQNKNESQKSSENSQDNLNKEKSLKPDENGQQKGQEKNQSEDKQKDEKDSELEEKEKNEKDLQKNQELNQQQKFQSKKLPAKLKQLMSDDRQIQMKMIERGTRDLNKKNSRTSKDW